VLVLHAVVACSQALLWNEDCLKRVVTHLLRDALQPRPTCSSFIFC
jgi:hypothetical protein